MRKSLMLASTLALSLGAIANAQEGTPATTAPVAAQAVTLTDVPAGHWAKDAVDFIVAKGLIQGFPDGTFRGNENLTRYQAALIFYRLLQTGALGDGSLSTEQVAMITKGMQEVSTELAAVSSRVADLEKLTAEQQTRIAALEERINTLGTTDTTALTARIDALEEAIKNMPAPTTTVVTPAPTTTVVTTPAPTTEPAPVTTAPVDNTTVVIGEVPTVTSSRGKLYAGVHATFNQIGKERGCVIMGTDTKVPFCSSFGGMIGSTQVLGPVGLRVNVGYQPVDESINADLLALYHLDMGTVRPYLGAGAGIHYMTKTAAGSNATDNILPYVNAIVGTDIGITNNIAAFVEGGVRYAIPMNKTDNTTTTDNLDPMARVGVKFFF